MALSTDDVRYIARLARLRFSEQEEQHLAEQEVAGPDADLAQLPAEGAVLSAALCSYNCALVAPECGAGEHGVGRHRRDSLAKRKSPVEMEMMRAIKKALDPKGIMNPGVLGL